MRTSVSGLVLLLCILMAAPRAAAQQLPTSSHAAPAAAIEQALQEHVAGVEADRGVVLRILERPDVQAVAREIGLDVRRAQTAVATLDGQQLADVAAQARQAEQALAGGQSSIRISTTLIIIALLVLILLIVAID
jgi:hypothetical protein